MFTALRGLIPHTIGHSPRADHPSHRAGTPAQAKADAAAHTHAQARIETLGSYLGSLTEQDRAEYIAAAQDLKDAMNETGTEDFRACYRGGRPPGDGSVPDGIRSLQQLRALARTIRTSSRPDPTEIPLRRMQARPPRIHTPTREATTTPTRARPGSRSDEPRWR